MNAIHWNRDLTKTLDSIRQREGHLQDKPDRGNGVVCFGEMRKAGIALCIATQIGHSVSQNSPLSGWNSAEIAWAQTQAQLAWYREMERIGELLMIRSKKDLAEWAAAQTETPSDSQSPIGFMLSLEGADSLVDLRYLDRAYEYGLRLLGPAHYGPGRYAAGTGETSGFTDLGFQLLALMDEMNMVLDVTHLTDLGFDEALENYSGPIIASHHNCRSLVNHQRQLTDLQIKRLAGRKSIIGIAFDAWMLVENWVRGESTPKAKQVTLENVVDQIDHVCQLTGSDERVAIGTDLDGGYGHEQTPQEIDSIAKLSLLDLLLQKRGYPDAAIKRILFENAFGFFERALP